MFHFPGGLADHLREQLGDRELIVPELFAGRADLPEDRGSVEWAVAWPLYGDGATSYYCNTVPTPDGGTHEAGLRSALTRGLKGFGGLIGKKKAAELTPEDVMTGAELMLSLFIRDPQFQSQTKDRLTSPEAARLVEAAVRDHFDHWLAGGEARARALLACCSSAWTSGCAAGRSWRASARPRRTSATSACPASLPTAPARTPAAPNFHRRGNSAGGSAKQARDRATQAVLPIRGKILNVASANTAKIGANQEVTDLIQALGCGTRKDYDPAALRYERVVIMTDADVDGAHIATLLMTFFFQEMPGLIRTASCSRAAAAVSAGAGRHRRLRARRRPPRGAYGDAVQGRQGRGRAVQGAWRDGLHAAPRDHDGPGQAHAAARHPARRSYDARGEVSALSSA